MQVCGRRGSVISSKVTAGQLEGNAGAQQTKKKLPTSILPPVSIFATYPPKQLPTVGHLPTHLPSPKQLATTTNGCRDETRPVDGFAKTKQIPLIFFGNLTCHIQNFHLPNPHFLMESSAFQHPSNFMLHPCHLLIFYPA